MSHMIQVHANAFASRKFEGRHHVAVARHNHDDINELSERQPGYVQSDSKIDALLLNVGNQILSDEWAR